MIYLFVFIICAIGFAWSMSRSGHKNIEQAILARVHSFGPSAKTVEDFVRQFGDGEDTPSKQ